MSLQRDTDGPYAHTLVDVYELLAVEDTPDQILQGFLVEPILSIPGQACSCKRLNFLPFRIAQASRKEALENGIGRILNASFFLIVLVYIRTLAGEIPGQAICKPTVQQR